MKKIKEIELDLDVKRFVEGYGITEDTDEINILYSVQDYLDGCEDYIYYNFSADEVYEEYKDQIKEAAKNNDLDLVKCFEEIIEHANLDGKLYRAAEQIKEIIISAQRMPKGEAKYRRV